MTRSAQAAVAAGRAGDTRNRRRERPPGRWTAPTREPGLTKVRARARQMRHVDLFLLRLLFILPCTWGIHSRRSRSRWPIHASAAWEWVWMWFPPKYVQHRRHGQPFGLLSLSLSSFLSHPGFFPFWQQPGPESLILLGLSAGHLRLRPRSATVLGQRKTPPTAAFLTIMGASRRNLRRRFAARPVRIDQAAARHRLRLHVRRDPRLIQFFGRIDPTHYMVLPRASRGR